MYVVTTSTGTLQIDAEEHRVEGLHHVFRSTTVVMGRPRLMVVRRIACSDVVSVSSANSL